MSNLKLVIDGQEFDTRLDFFVCRAHGIITPDKFAGLEWTTDEGCPVPTYMEEPCGESITAVLLDSMVQPPEEREGQVTESAPVLSEDEMRLIVTSRVPMTQRELKEWRALRDRVGAYLNASTTHNPEEG